jgi:citrate lyase beta subunit
MRQPVHVLYGGAHLFRSELVAKVGRIALAALDAGSGELGDTGLVERVRAKLEREPVEDYRIDFEDGYGVRADADEDAAAEAAGRQLTQGMAQQVLPPFIGIRIKPQPERGHRTLNLFLDAAGTLPEGFVVTLPKVEGPGEIEHFRETFPALALEVMIETPRGLAAVDSILDAGAGVLRAVHFGPYDFLSSCGVPGPAQRLGHPLCDHARLTLVPKLAAVGMRLADGPTSFLPIGSPAEITEARRLHRANILHAIDCGIFQGWDLHPAQLPVRYATLYSFFREHAPGQRKRLDNYRENLAQATRVGAAFDDAATARGLELFFDRARDCGALSPDELP